MVNEIMKKVLLSLSMLLVLCACNNTGKPTGDTLAEENVECEEFNPHSFLMTADSLPDKVDLSVDISNMTYQELRLLKNYVYATKGVWFMEAEINSFFCTKCDWYFSRCYDVLEQHDWSESYVTDFSNAKLTQEETAFVKKIDERMAEMEKHREMDRSGLKLLNPALTVNMFVLDEFDQQFYAKLNQNNFVIVPTENQQLFNVYEQNDYNRIPNYVTTDVYLQAFHMYFSYVLKMVERQEFVDRIHNVCVNMNKRAMEVVAQTTNAEIKDIKVSKKDKPLVAAPDGKKKPTSVNVSNVGFRLGQQFEKMYQNMEADNRRAGVKGISLRKAREISETYRAQAGMRRLMEFLSANGLRPEYAMRLYRLYGDAAMEMVRANPYLIAAERVGGGFDEADALALSLGFEEDSPQRIAAALIYEIRYNLNNGHSFLPREKLTAATAQLIGVDADTADECLDVLEDEGEVVIEPVANVTAVYLRRLHEAGARVMISSDCHDARYLDCGFADAAELARSCGFETAWMMRGDRFEEYPL